MKNLSLVLLALTILQSCAQYNNKGIQGNGNLTTIQRTTAEYDNIACSGSWNFQLVKGIEGQLTLHGESNLLPYIITEVHGNTLTIKQENGVDFSTNRDITIMIPVQSISEVSLTGSGDLYNDDVIQADVLDVDLTGSGDIILDIETQKLTSSVTGSGDITINGTTEALVVEVTGSGDFHGQQLKAKNTDVTVTGSGDADVVSTTFLKARVSGSGDISYTGNPEKEDIKVSGSGSIEMN